MSKLLLLYLTYVIPYVLLQQPKIIIVGAGTSGIAAATCLLQHGFTDITILEAESRIGGRIQTVRFGNSYVDLGAQWCHGEKANIVYEKVKGLDLLENSNLNQKIVFSPNVNVSKTFVAKLLSIINKLDETGCTNVMSEYNNLGEACTNSFYHRVHQVFEGNVNEINIALEAIDFYSFRVLGFEGAFSWFEVSVEKDYTICEGDQELHWKRRGFNIILEVLMKKYPHLHFRLPLEKLVLLNKEVKKLYWKESIGNRVRIICSDNSVYVADHVIFTPSIGVLKEQHQTIFEPVLPLKKQDAIKNIGFGAVIKIWIYFSEKWWEDDINYFLIWEKNDIEMAKSRFPEGSDVTGRSWTTYLVDFFSDKYRPNLLLGFVTGDIVPFMEYLSEQVIKNGLYFVLDKFFGDSHNVSRPNQILLSTWYSNSHFRGTYSYQTLRTVRLKNGPSSADELAKPLRNTAGRPVVQFAGEATHPIYYSTVHGAIESGYKEAKILISLYS